MRTACMFQRLGTKGLIVLVHVCQMAHNTVAGAHLLSVSSRLSMARGLPLLADNDPGAAANFGTPQQCQVQHRGQTWRKSCHQPGYRGYQVLGHPQGR